MKEEKKNRIYKTIMIIAISVILTFTITTISLYGYFAEHPINTSESENQTQNISSALKRYREIIDKYYLGEVDDEKLKEGAIKGYIAGLNDPYTEYISKDDMKDYISETLGNFTGIGIYMVKDTETNRIKVLSTIKNSPAEKVGIKPGDLIISADGVEYTADDMQKAANNIKGEEGTNVKLVVLRDNQTLTFDITREKIKENQVEGKVLSNNIGYIKFTSFDESTAEDFKNEFEELNKKGIKSLIID